MIMMFALLVVPITFVLGAVAVDASLWQSERRGAQKDADLASLAGAYELLDQSAGEAMTIDAAQQAVDTNQDVNDESGNAEIIDDDDIEDVLVDKTCFNSEELDSVTVNVRHESETFFSSIFGLDIAPDIGAHARACMGSPIEGEGLLPLGVQVSGFDTECFDDHDGDSSTPELPQFGQYCRLAFAGDELSSGEGGFLRLFDDGSSSCSAINIDGEDQGGAGRLLREEIAEGGANTTCYVAPPGASCDDVPADWPYGDEVNYCVWPKTQTFNNPTQNAFHCLIRGSDEVGGNACQGIAGEGECDTKFGSDANDYDDWLEVVEAVDGDPSPSPDTTFARRDCTSPRLVDLIIIEQFDLNGNSPRPIIAFASFYIDACEVDGVQFRDCDVTGGNIGQASLYGFFMNILNIGTIGAYNGFGQRTIALWE
jgi:hypothetical protein